MPRPIRAGRSSFDLRGRVALVVAVAIGLGLPSGCRKAAETDVPAAGPAIGGTRLRLLVVDDPALAQSVGRLRGEWQATSGAKLEIAEMSEEEALRASALEADAVIYPAYRLGLFVDRGWLAPLRAQTLSDPAVGWAEIFDANKAREATWGGTLYGVPFGSPVFVCFYRADLLQQFQRRPPQTWAEYHELAQFFSARANLADAAPAADRPWGGAVEPLAPGWAGLTLLARAAAYAKHRSHYSTLFNIDSMEPLVDGPPFVRALEELVAASRHGLADERTFGPAEVRRAFRSGQCALALSWPVSALVEGDQAAGDRRIETGFVPLPGSAEVYGPGAKAWEMRREGESPRVPLLGLAGRLGSVTKRCPRQDAALELLAWLAGPKWSASVSSASPATTLFRESHLESGQSWVGQDASAAEASQYLEAVQQSLAAEEILFAPRIPGRELYLAALDEAVDQAVAGEATAEAALARAASRWREITADLGLVGQRRAYQRSLGLNP